MKVYIAYKYTHVQNKEAIRNILERIANILGRNGYDQFVLGRDVKHWKHVNFFKLIPSLMKHLSNRDILLAYIDSDKKSYGLLFELLFARFMGKPTIILIGNNAKGGIYKFIAKKKFTVNNVEELENIVTQALPPISKLSNTFVTA